MKQAVTTKRRAAKPARRFNNLEVQAFSRRDDFLAYTITLPGVTEAWVRKLIKMPRGVIIYDHALGMREIATVQGLVEVKLDPKKFRYYFDGSQFFRVKKSTIEYDRRMKSQENKRTGT